MSHFVWLPSLCLLLLVGSTGRSEEHGSETVASRRYGEPLLAVSTQNLLRQVFSLSLAHSKELVRPLATALDRANAGEERPIAEELARLFTSLNGAQLRNLVDVVETGGDDGELKQRLLWGARILGEMDALDGFEDVAPPSPEFKEAFTAALGPIAKEKEEFFDLLERARNGDATAKETLRGSEKYRDMAGFLRGQLESGNRELAGRIAEALADKNQEGEHSLDLLGSDGKPARLVLGKDPSGFAEGLANFQVDRLETPGRHGGFQNYSISPERHTNQTLRERGLTIRPRFSVPEGGDSAPESSPSAPEQTTPPQPTPATRPPLSTKSLAKMTRDDLDEAVARFATRQGCVGCHGEDSRFNLPLFDKQGNLLARAADSKRGRLLQVLAGHRIPPDGKMKGILARLNLTNAEKAIFGKWGREHGLSDERNPFLKEAGLEPVEKESNTNVAEEKDPQDIEEARERGLFRDLVEPEDLARRVREAKDDPRKKNFRLWSLGVVDPPIHGSEVIGGIFDDQPFKGLEALEQGPNPPGKDEEIILYCGCCSIEFCPNVLAALPKLKAKGYTNVRVLNLEEDFFNDWEARFDLEGNQKTTD